jgi:hypothetical protein
MSRVSPDLAGTAIVTVTDTTGGAVTNAVDATVAGTKDDVATLAAKINEILVALRAYDIIVD